jgi:hypothetical protein
MLRAEKGGSYSVDVALNYYSQWLVGSCGTYPEQVWTDLWESYDKPVFRHYHSMLYSIPRVLGLMAKNKDSSIRQDRFFEDRPAENLGTSIKTVKPILTFPNGEVELKFNVGTRGNGADMPRWPEDLLTQVVT